MKQYSQSKSICALSWFHLRKLYEKPLLNPSQTGTIFFSHEQHRLMFCVNRWTLVRLESTGKWDVNCQSFCYKFLGLASIFFHFSESTVNIEFVARREWQADFNLCSFSDRSVSMSSVSYPILPRSCSIYT